MAITEEDVVRMIREYDEKLRADLNAIIAHDGEALKAEMVMHRGEITTHRAALVDQESRVSKLIDEQNQKNQAIIEGLTSQQAVLTQQHQQARQALDETQNLDGRLKNLAEQLTKLGQDAKGAIDNVDV